jgi:hypothetical protein
MTTSTLTDRYVWAVLRAVPSDQRKDLEPEVRALVADAIDARGDTGASDPSDTERAALTELGDPSALAARYTNRSLVLIGPNLYPEWRRLLTTLLPIVPPIVGLVVVAANLASGSNVGQAIAAGIGTGLQVVLQMLFWITLVFAVIERTVGATGLEPHAWSVDDLPDLPAEGRIGVVEFAATLVFDLLVLGALLWVQLASPIVIGGVGYPLFDPALWSFWLPFFIGILLLETLMTIGIFLRGGWTYPFAAVNAVLSAAFAIPAVYLMLNGMLFNPALVDALESIASGSWFGFTSAFIAVIVLGISAFDAIDGFVKARRANLATAPAPDTR